MVIVASGMAHGRVPPSYDDDDVAQNGGHTPEKSLAWASYVFDIDHLPFVKSYLSYKMFVGHCAFLNHVENRPGIFHFAYTNRLREKATKSLARC